MERAMRIELTSPAWKAEVLPLNYARSETFKKWAEADSNHRSASATDLQSVLVDHLSICPKWSWREELNPRPTDYKSVALPTELRQQITTIFFIKICQSCLLHSLDKTGRQQISCP